MDYSLVTSAVASLKAAGDIGKAMLSIRDGNLVAAEVARLNDQLLKAQEALFAHNAQLLALQQEHFETAQKLRKLEEALAERGRYSLVEITPGQLAYRVDVAPKPGGAGEPGGTQPLHYVCQPCFDNGRERRKVVLQRFEEAFGSPKLRCPVCETEIKAAEV